MADPFDGLTGQGIDEAKRRFGEPLRTDTIHNGGSGVRVNYLRLWYERGPGGFVLETSNQTIAHPSGRRAEATSEGYRVEKVRQFSTHAELHHAMDTWLTSLVDND